MATKAKRTDEKNLALPPVHNPRDIRRAKIHFKEEAALATSLHSLAEQTERRPGIGSSEEDESVKSRSSDDSNIQVLYQCCVYLCASIIFSTIIIGVVAFGYIFHLN